MDIEILKDIVTMFVSIIITIITILTYLKAKETILQPLRSEVIKKQINELTELLRFLSEKYIFDSIDYEKIVSINVIEWLDFYGFILDDHENLMKDIKNHESGFIICNLDTVAEYVHHFVPFESEKNINKEKEYRKKTFDKALNGEIEIDKIFITKKYREFIDEYEKFLRNPLMPRKIQGILKDLQNQIKTNLNIILPQVLKIFFFEYFDDYKKNPENHTKCSAIGVYNDFNHKRIHHKEAVQKLINEIRNYLKVDEMPHLT